jgi:hypothetical protein
MVESVSFLFFELVVAGAPATVPPRALSRWHSVSGEHLTDPITIVTLRTLAQRNGNGYGFVWVDLSFLESQSPPGVMHFPGPPGIFVPLNFLFPTARLYGHESQSPVDAI